MILYRRVVDQKIDRHEHGTFVKELVVSRGGTPLAMVRKRAAAREKESLPPVLLIHGFGQNRNAWHLPSRSFANYLAQAGYDVFNVDLRGHGRSRHFGGRRARGVEDYVHEDLPNAVEEVLAVNGKKRVFLLGHSLGGLVSYAGASALGDRVAGIASVGSPFHFARGSFSLNAIALLFRALEVSRVPTLNPPLVLGPVGWVYRRMRRFAESPIYPVPLRGWHKGAIEPEILDEHMRLAFDRASFAEMKNMFEWASKRRFGTKSTDYAAAFRSLDVPLLVIAGDNDDLAPPTSVKPAFDRSLSRDRTYRTFPLGHIDLLVGREAPITLWPAVRGWLDARRPRADGLSVVPPKEAVASSGRESVLPGSS